MIASLLLIAFDLLVIELTLYALGHLVMKGSRRGMLSLQRKLGLFLVSLALVGVVEICRYMAAVVLLRTLQGETSLLGIEAWLVYPAAFSVPFVPVFLLLSVALAFLNEGRIAACDKCNEWIVPFGGTIRGSSWGTPDLICLGCSVRARLLEVLYFPIGKLAAVMHWLSRGLWPT